MAPKQSNQPRATSIQKFFYFYGGRKFAKTGLSALLIKITNLALGLCTTILLARMLGPDGFGIFALALAVVTLLAFPANAGVPQLITKETARAHSRSNWSSIKGIWCWSTRIVICVSIMVMAATGAIGYSFYEQINSELRATLIASILLIPFAGLSLVRASSLRGLGFTIKGQIPELIIKPASLIILLIGLAFISSAESVSAQKAMTMNVIASSLAFFVGAIMLRLARPADFDQVTPTYESRRWLTTILPMASVNVMHLVNTQSDIILIGFFLDHNDVGQYKLAAQISLIVAFGLQATKMVVEPHFSRLYHEGQIARLQQLARAASRVNVTVGLILFFVIFLFGDQLLTMLFGQVYAAAFTPMLILSSGRLISSAFASSGSVLVMSGFHNLYARYWTVSALLNVVLNIILIPLLGMNGAALATAVTIVIPHILGWRAAQQRIGCNCLPFGIARIRKGTNHDET